MSKLEAEMAFEIGDIVYFKTALHDEHARPTAFLVLERFLQECPGGIQKSYVLTEQQHAVLEIALTKDRPKYEPSEHYKRGWRDFSVKYEADKKSKENT